MKTKFRAWDKKEKKMYLVASIDFVLEKIEIWTNTSKNAYGISSIMRRFSDIVLMQYTGLKDSEGTEIYKGDIGWDDVRERYGIVDFIDGKFGYASENDYEDLCEVCNDIVIRGNIHENKDLLEGE